MESARTRRTAAVTKQKAGWSGRRGPPHQVRIVGGRYRRTVIPVLDEPGLRPTPDRVRETVFNWLTHLLTDLSPVRGLDLFAGTGALGFELASRGAQRVVLVERNPRLVEQLRRLRQRLQAEAVEILPADGLAAPLPAGGFDLIFLDPPFDAGLLLPALSRARTLLAPQGLVYAEAAAPISAARAGELGLDLVRAGRAGAVHFHLLRQRGS